MKRLIFLLIPALLLAGLIVWRVVLNQKQKTMQSQAADRRKHAAPNVRVAPAIVRDIVHEFQGVGSVQSPLDVQISAKVTGRIIYLKVREGDPVTRGEVLARTDPEQVQATINQAQAAITSTQANLNNAQVRYNRTYYLYKQRFTAAQDVDDARTQVEVERAAVTAAKAQVANLQSQLSDTILRSPINGFVTSRLIDPGSVVTAGQAIVAVQSMKRVYLTTSVPEGVQGIHVGIPADADFDAMPGRKFHGKVTHVNPAADPQSREFLVRAIFDNAQDLIRPGMYGRLTVTTQVTHNAIVVPHEAIQSDPQGSFVIVVDEKQVAHKRSVKTGDQDRVGIAITQGVEAGDKVVILSAQPVRDGQQVKIDNSGAPLQLAGQPTVEGGGGGSESSSSSRSTGGASAPTYSVPSGGTPSGGAASPGSSSSNSSTESGAGTSSSTGAQPLIPSGGGGGGLGTQSSGGSQGASGTGSTSASRPGGTANPTAGTPATGASGSTGTTGTGSGTSATGATGSGAR